MALKDSEDKSKRWLVYVDIVRHSMDNDITNDDHTWRERKVMWFVENDVS